MTRSNLFQLIDFDRTVFDTGRFIKALTDAIDEDHPGLGTELRQRAEDAYAQEKTFFVLRYLRHEKSDVWLEELVERVVQQHGSDTFLLPGVPERIALAPQLTSHAPAWGFLTYGDKVDQLMKLRIAGFADAPVYITRTPKKSDVLRAWMTSDGQFELPDALGGGRADMLSLEDDKERAFYNLPKNVVGVWVVPPGHKQAAASRQLPGAVTAVRSLSESAAVLRELFAK